MFTINTSSVPQLLTVARMLSTLEDTDGAFSGCDWIFTASGSVCATTALVPHVWTKTYNGAPIVVIELWLHREDRVIGPWVIEVGTDGGFMLGSDGAVLRKGCGDDCVHGALVLANDIRWDDEFARARSVIAQHEENADMYVG